MCSTNKSFVETIFPGFSKIVVPLLEHSFRRTIWRWFGPEVSFLIELTLGTEFKSFPLRCVQNVIQEAKATFRKVLFRLGFLPGILEILEIASW